MTPFDRSLAAVDTAEKELKKLEDGQIASINVAMQQSLLRLMMDLRGKYKDRGGADLLGRDRAILLANDLRDTLNIFSPKDPAVIVLLSELQQTLALSAKVGDESAKAGYLKKGFGTESSADLSLSVAGAVARGAHDMLLNHGAQFASNASIAIQQGVLLGYGYNKTASIVKTLADVTRSKAETIVRTETVRAAASAMTERFKSDGIDQVIWIATQDKRCCPRCAALAGRILDRKDAVLPLHPNDRCTLIAYKKSWDDAGLVDHDWLENHQKETFVLAGGNASDFKAAPSKAIEIPELTAKQEELIDSIPTNYRDLDRTSRILSAEPQLKPMEGRALSHYIGSYYEKINRTFWDKDEFSKEDRKLYDKVSAAAFGATLALLKIKPITTASLSREAKDGVAESDGKPLARDGLLTHTMAIDDPKLLAKYIGDRAEGKTISAEKLLSTSWAEGGEAEFNVNCNIEVRIKPRLDGGGQGRLVDKYKNGTFENEVLFHPQSSFIVTKQVKIDAVEEISHFKVQPQETLKYSQLSKIVETLEMHINTPGLKIADGEKWSFSSDEWKELNSVNKLPAYPETEAQAVKYLEIVKKKILVEAKNNVPGKWKTVDREYQQAKTIIFMSEL